MSFYGATDTPVYGVVYTAQLEVEFSFTRMKFWTPPIVKSAVSNVYWTAPMVRSAVSNVYLLMVIHN